MLLALVPYQGSSARAEVEHDVTGSCSSLATTTCSVSKWPLSYPVRLYP